MQKNIDARHIRTLFWQTSPNLFFLSIVLSCASGFLYSLLVPFVTYALSLKPDEPSYAIRSAYTLFHSPTQKVAWFFLVACTAIMFLRAASGILTIYVTNKVSYELRLDVYRRIQRLPIQNLERIGFSRLINIVNIDIPRITTASTSLSFIWVGCVTIVSSLGYLFWLNKKVFYIVVAYIFIASLTYQLPMLVAMRFFSKAREKYDEVQEGFRGLVHGAKQLKLSQGHAHAFYKSELVKPESLSFKNNLSGNVVLFFSASYGDLASFLIIGFTIFHLRYTLSLADDALFGIAMVLLYITGPVGTILAHFGNVRQGAASEQKIADFYAALIEEGDAGSEALPADWQELRVKNLHFSYPESGFSIRNIDLTFRRGQITFLVGGNGSGKSTLGKCLSLHYLLTKGSIGFDTTVINAANLQSAREKISVIYPDYHLFKKLYVKDAESLAGKIHFYLQRLNLDHKVRFKNGAFSTTDLSDGQRKRLALVTLLAADRDICIFDEWAADQDPEFKHIFYSEILQELKQQGKTIIVISHDDRYFQWADQIVSMADGEIASIRSNTHLVAVGEAITAS